MTSGRNLHQALAYARHGWPVFPISPGGKTPAIASAHPKGDPAGGHCTGQCGRDGHGFHDATTDEARIRGWWAVGPDRNIGIATGHPGPDVVDVDQHGKHGNGFGAWNQARRAGLVDRPLAVVQTPSRGMHAYFHGTSQRSASIDGRHLDFRSAGGYVVAPHSTIDGKPYVVVQRQRSAATVDFGAIRQLVALQPQRAEWQPPQHLREGGAQNLDHLIEHMAGLEDGRKRYLFWAANRICDHRQEDRLPELAAAARAAGSDPRQIDRTIESARRQARQDPHQSPTGHPQAQAGSPARPPEQDREGARRTAQPARAPGGHELEPRPAPGPVMEADWDGPEDRPGGQGAGRAGTATPGELVGPLASQREAAHADFPAALPAPAPAGGRLGRSAENEAQRAPFAAAGAGRRGPDREAGA